MSALRRYQSPGRGVIRIAHGVRGFRMKRLTHKLKFLFATNFSWWSGSPGTGLTAGFSRAFEFFEKPG